MSSTFQVTCAECGKEKWPTMPVRPERYVCVLCRAADPKSRANRRAAAARRSKKGPDSAA